MSNTLLKSLENLFCLEYFLLWWITGLSFAMAFAHKNLHHMSLIYLWNVAWNMWGFCKLSMCEAYHLIWFIVYVLCSQREFLLAIEAISTMIHFYLRTKTPETVKIKTNNIFTLEKNYFFAMYSVFGANFIFSSISIQVILNAHR